MQLIVNVLKQFLKPYISFTNTLATFIIYIHKRNFYNICNKAYTAKKKKQSADGDYCGLAEHWYWSCRLRLNTFLGGLVGVTVDMFGNTATTMIF